MSIVGFFLECIYIQTLKWYVVSSVCHWWPDCHLEGLDPVELGLKIYNCSYVSISQYFGYILQLSSDWSRANIHHVAVVITAYSLWIRLVYEDMEVIDVIGARIQQTSWALSLATNMVATSLIAYKAWSVLHPWSLKRSMLWYLTRKHQKSIRSNLGSLKRPTKIQKTLALLVGSGLLYCILWVGQTWCLFYSPRFKCLKFCCLARSHLS